MMTTFNEWLMMREGAMGLAKFGQRGNNPETGRQAMIVRQKNTNSERQEELEKAGKLKELEGRKAAYASRGSASK